MNQIRKGGDNKYMDKNNGLKLILYYSSDHKPLEDPANRGLSEVDRLWEKLPKNINKEKIDTNNMDEEELGKIYSKSCYPSVFTKKYKIRQVFGSRKRSGCFFCREVPALLVYKDIEYPIDVYPHEEKGGKIITIKEFLEKLIE